MRLPPYQPAVWSRPGWAAVLTDYVRMSMAVVRTYLRGSRTW